jgi:hypothetical protein
VLAVLAGGCSLLVPYQELPAGDSGGAGPGSGGGGRDQHDNGEKCSVANACASGNCVDGVCCAQASCGGPCAACNLPASPGTCSVVPAGTVCRASADVCDAEEQCDGLAVSCPANQPEPMGRPCRAPEGPCDVAEVCDGVAIACPADAVAKAGDAGTPGCSPYMCDGADKQCPTSCATVADCDPAGKCTSGGCLPLGVWSKRFGDAASQRAHGVAVDAAGNVLVVGELEGSLDAGGGPLVSAGGQDAFVAKFDANGAHLWSKRFGDAEPQVALDVSVDGAGNVIACGSLTGVVDFGGGPLATVGFANLFVVALDAGGAHQWSRRFGDFHAEYVRCRFDAAGNVLLAGHFRGKVDFGGGPLASTQGPGADIFVAKLDAAGNHLWSKRFGDGANQRANGLAVDGAGNVVVAGGFDGTLDFGSIVLTSSGVEDVFVAKLDATGAPVWAKRFGDSAQQAATAVAVDAAGDVVLTGSFSGTLALGGPPLQATGFVDAFVAKLGGAAGAHLWSKPYGLAGFAAGLDVATYQSRVLVTGAFTGSLDLGGGPFGDATSYQAFVVKLDPAGGYFWSKAFGDSGSDQGARGIAVAPNGDVLVAGDFEGAIDLGKGPLVSAGLSDAFLAKLTP